MTQKSKDENTEITGRNLRRAPYMKRRNLT